MAVTARFLLFLLGAVTTVLGQDTVPAKAGDRAPEIDWTKVVQSPESAKYQPSLTGQYTVLQFVPPVTPNAQAIGQWNKLIAQFRDQPVQFVWIASENWSLVQPFLREHPMRGWLLIDEKNDIAREYGCEMGGDVIVDPLGKIAGFTPFPDPQQLSGVLDGKAVAIARGTEDHQVFKLLEGGKVRLEAEPERTDPPRSPEKPDIAPSYEVHISPSKTKGTDGSSGPDFWVQRGFGLKTMTSMVYEKDPSRVALPESLDKDDKFDFVVVLPEERDEQTIHQLVQRAIEKKFNVSAVVESKPAEVYVMTAIKGKTPPAKTRPDSFGGGSTSSSGFEFSLPAGTPPTPEAMNKAVQELLKRPENIGIANIFAGNASMEQFRQDLERGLGRPVIDETGLEGVYDVEVQGNATNTDEFIRMLRDQTGLVLTAATRSIEVLTLKSLN
jgi:uncharacterized protein (TIGR03435 family)